MESKLSFLKYVLIIFSFIAFISCNKTIESDQDKPILLLGTWELISATTIEGESVTVKDLTDKQMIKIINHSHFAFLNHDINKEADSLNYYVSGGGKYELSGNQYVEYLEYCTARVWEGNEFKFEVEIHGDTLTQRGIEKVEEIGVDREIIEVYVKSQE